MPRVVCCLRLGHQAHCGRNSTEAVRVCVALFFKGIPVVELVALVTMHRSDVVPGDACRDFGVTGGTRLPVRSSIMVRNALAWSRGLRCLSLSHCSANCPGSPLYEDTRATSPGDQGIERGSKSCESSWAAALQYADPKPNSEDMYLLTRYL
ncbi:hypothetical protein C8Q72DRAFT_88759 [Fomitopsis betulina]|nr:hypothetical protein C8Q72DRAFT_88759 [Fomitopsis betulina]